MEEDLATGKLDALIGKAEADIAANNVRDINEILDNDFCQAYAALSPEIKQQARKADQLWKENPFHPSLHLKAEDGRSQLSESND